MRGLVEDIEVAQQDLREQAEALRETQSRLQGALRHSKQELSGAFHEQRALEEELAAEKPKETGLLQELNSLNGLLKQRLKLLARLQTDSQETVVGYEKMAAGLAAKHERHQAQHEEDTARFVARLQAQGEAISAREEALIARQGEV